MKLLGIVIALLAMCLFVGDSFAKGGKGGKAGKQAAVSGKVTAANVDATGKGTITVKPHAKKGAAAAQETTITTDGSTVFTVGGVAGKGVDVQVGMKVKATVATGTAIRVDATTAKAGGGKKGKKNG